ncbi:MAG: hypothetical protein Q8M95_07160 [Candidatus Methanoperedens sp.]|nr:hypothetical protein [Candidatus Methanoperedens sp.]
MKNPCECDSKPLALCCPGDEKLRKEWLLTLEKEHELVRDTSNEIAGKFKILSNSDRVEILLMLEQREHCMDEMAKPGLKAAIHGKCMYCHKEVFGGPEGCKLCHTMGTPTTVVVPAPARPHTLTWEQCIRCHPDGIPGGQSIKIVYHDFCIKCHTNGIAEEP